MRQTGILRSNCFHTITDVNGMLPLDRFEAVVNSLRHHVFELENEIKTAKKALEKAGPAYSDVVQKSTTKARAPLVPKPLIPLTTKPALSAQLRITDSGKGKGKLP